MKVRFKKIHPNAVIPTKAHATDAGFDLVATSREEVDKLPESERGANGHGSTGK